MIVVSNPSNGSGMQTTASPLPIPPPHVMLDKLCGHLIRGCGCLQEHGIGFHRLEDLLYFASDLNPPLFPIKALSP